MATLKEAEAGRSVNEIWRKDGIRFVISYKGKGKCSGLGASDFKRVRELAEENNKLKRQYADLSLENAALMKLIEEYGLRPT